MSTVDKNIADQIVAGKFPEDGAQEIWEYDNAFGGVSYGVIFPRDAKDKYAPSGFVRNPRLYWRAGA